MSVELERSQRAALTQIQKVLELEARKGYQNTSASNGIPRFVGERVASVLPALELERQRYLREIDTLLSGYDQLDRDRRQHSVAESLKLLDLLLNEAGQQAAQPRPERADGEKEQRRSSAGQTGKKLTRRQAGARVGSLSDSVQLLPSVGAGRMRQLEQLGVRTIRDLLYLYPRRYVDYSQLDPIAFLRFGQLSTIQGTVQSVSATRTRTGKTMVDVVLADETGSIHAVWFNPYIERQLHEGMPVSLSGRVDQLRGNLCFKSPEWEPLNPESIHTGRIVPIYPLTKGLYQKTLRGIVRAALDSALDLIQDYLPEATFQRVHNPRLVGLREAIEWIHFPEGDTPEEARQRRDLARARLAFDEFLSMQLGLLQQKLELKRAPGNSISVDRSDVDGFIARLPFELTGAQARAIDEILADMADVRPMTRLLQGDVGSGKTAVAAVAAYVAIRAGYQTALMAPTELLAEQHSRSLEGLFEALPEASRPRIGLITGGMAAAGRRDLHESVADGSLDLVVGTHALIQEGIQFERLGLAVVDEQHRFGVEQRGALREKGVDPDVLVMTATPIPRSLALTIHGDLDVSTLDEMPPGRQPVETYWVQGNRREDAYTFVREQVEAGRQAFIVFPLVEESEIVDARSAVEEHARLSRDVFPDLSVGLIHGRMRPAEKDEIMAEFRDRQIDILVATSVIEVGIDIPNATILLIEGADRFGLAQLHQFRGRVGRGAEKSYCVLLASNDLSPEGQRRLEAMVDTGDGFRLAQIDLELRGPGDFLGTRQSGLPELQLASFADMRDLERARAEATRLLEDDPELKRAEHALLRARVEKFWSSTVAEVS